MPPILEALRVKGKPMHLVKMESSEVARRINECWEWVGSKTTNSYGSMVIQGRGTRPYRLIYESFSKSKIPYDKCVDHLCNNPPCINPFHLRVTTQRENVLRSETNFIAINARKTKCPKGHNLSGDNLKTTKGKYGLLRSCKLCIKQRIDENLSKGLCRSCSNERFSGSRSYCAKHLKMCYDHVTKSRKKMRELRDAVKSL